jgi:6-phosphogluconolactonase (cycloisomerase 2 family)
MSVRDILQAAAGVGGAPPVSNAWDLAFATFEGIAPNASISGYEINATDVKFSSDGTKMYVLGDQRDAVLQYNLSTPYQPSTAVFPRKNVSAEEINPTGVEFKPDGTKMYVIGSTGDDVNEYDLSTAWDVTTASYVQNFSVSAQAGTSPAKVRFKDDGTKMYVLSSSNDEVYQYSLSTAWNVSTASYDSVSLSVTSQEATPRGLFFGDSGTKMYIVGEVNDTVYQYTLTSGWDLSTASYASLSFSVTSQETLPTDVFFKSDGTIMYVIGTLGDDVNQYALSSAWNVSTASFTKVSLPSFNTWFGEINPNGVYIKPDGTQLYVVGSTTDSVWQQSMSSAWDVATLIPGLYVNAQESAPQGLAFKNDGTKMYIVGTSNDTVYQYSLATAWDVLTATYDSVSFSVATQEITPNGITFKTDGTKMYIIGSSGDDVNEYNLSTAWNVSTASFVQVFSVFAQTGTTPAKVEFKDDGTKMYVLSNSNNTVFQYTLSSAWDVSTASYDSVSYAFAAINGENNSSGLAFADSGTKMYIIGSVTDRVWGFALGTAWNLATTNSYYRSVAAEENGPRSVTFKPDGTEMYVLGETGDDVNQYSISTAWQVQTASYVRVFGVGTQTGAAPAQVQFKDDGTKMYVLSNTNDAIYQYSLSTAWNISTATYDTVSFSVTSQESLPRGMFFGDAGTKLYVVGTTNNTVYQYTLSSAWDLSTASYASKSFSVATQETSPYAVFIGNNGSAMYIVGFANDTVYQYTLATPWDVSTASYATKSFAVGVYETNPSAVWFKDDGLSFYVVGSANDVVWQFTIS